MRRPVASWRARIVTATVAATVVSVLAALPGTPAGAATCPTAGGAAVPEATATGDVVLRGHGWGHVLGMSQYGAQGAARLGCTYDRILATYYRGAALVAAPMPTTVRLRMLDNGGRADVTTETGAAPWQLVDASGAHGALQQPRATTYRLYRDATRPKFRVID